MDRSAAVGREANQAVYCACFFGTYDRGRDAREVEHKHDFLSCRGHAVRTLVCRRRISASARKKIFRTGAERRTAHPKLEVQ